MTTSWTWPRIRFACAVAAVLALGVLIPGLHAQQSSLSKPAQRTTIKTSAAQSRSAPAAAPAATARALGGAPAPAQPAIPYGSRIFDATLYLNKPEINGLAPQLKIIYANFMNRDFEGNLRDLYPGARLADLRLLVDQAIAQGCVYVAFDVENPIGGDHTAEATMQRLVRSARAYRPEINYSCCYLPATYPAGKAQQGTLAEVQATNNALAPTIKLMDFLLPEAYLHDDPGKGAPVYNAWYSFMQMGVAEARRVAPGKPVFPVLSLCPADYGWSGPMTYHGPIPTDFFIAQVQATLMASGGNAVLWGATKANPNGSFVDWDSTAPWYVAMLRARMLTLGQEAQRQLDRGSVDAAIELNTRHPGR